MFTNFNVQPKLTCKFHYLYIVEVLTSASLYYFSKPVISEFKRPVAELIFIYFYFILFF